MELQENERELQRLREALRSKEAEIASRKRQMSVLYDEDTDALNDLRRQAWPCVPPRLARQRERERGLALGRSSARAAGKRDAVRRQRGRRQATAALATGSTRVSRCNGGTALGPRRCGSRRNVVHGGVARRSCPSPGGRGGFPVQRREEGGGRGRGPRRTSHKRASLVSGGLGVAPHSSSSFVKRYTGGSGWG